MNYAFQILFLVFNLCCLKNYCYSQDSTNYSLNHNEFLKDGIYIESLNTTIPWGIRFDSLYDKYNSKGIYKIQTKKKYFVLGLDSVFIFNGLKVNIIFRGRQKGLFHYESSLNKLSDIQISYNQTLFEDLRNFFQPLTQKPETLWGSKHGFYCVYYINNCWVGLGKVRRDWILIQWKEAYK